MTAPPDQLVWRDVVIRLLEMEASGLPILQDGNPVKELAILVNTRDNYHQVHWATQGTTLERFIASSTYGHPQGTLVPFLKVTLPTPTGNVTLSS